ncbi:hypothetical protein BIY22_15335 [Vibrio panuliri]|uniref:HEAT repeat domain-containing protein n=1 Tax=Vibrio panuliri TaxID=1381081 RepID=A0A1Q9HNN7_9VIBR|nr:hypothetical protein [Vibrio panuliri]OLQ92423.1 hypothetical protein BIY22_15335 [Vibrio panuliri]
MQQGMLSSLLLTLFLALGVPQAMATQMTPERVELWRQSDHMQVKVAELLQYVVEDNIDTLNFSLERLAFPQQEVARYLLLQKLEQQDVLLTPKMAIFVESQKAMIPTYQVLERGDGYEFTTPAFNYPAIASRLLKRWQQDQSTLDFVMKAERQELDLQLWLTGGSVYQNQTRERLLMRELDSLSPMAIQGLTSQFTDEAVVSWLPSAEVVVRLAQVSEDPEMYKLLWLMKANLHSENELIRLGRVADEFAVKQIMLAAKNPQLNELAIKQLVGIKPMSNEVQEYLIAKMGSNDEVSFVARQLVEQGYSGWLAELANSDKRVKSHDILNVLSQ